MLIRLMESYVRSEFDRLKEDDKINHLIRDVKLRNHQPPQNLKRVKEVEVDDDILPPPIFQSDDEFDWEYRLNELGWEMLSNIKPPTKIELVKNIQSLKSPSIEVLEVFGRSDKTKLNLLFDKMVNKGNFSVIFIKE